MKTKGKNKHNYADALENEHLYAVLTKQVASKSSSSPR
jgi:hypothetical protein